MTQTILIIAIVVAVALLAPRKSRETAVGICASALDQTVRKSGNKEKAIAFLKEAGGEAGNREIREHLGVTDRTVVNYMDELEREGKVRQVGKTGKGVVYRIVT
jgi:predicted HTH transcriptional regulator